MINITCSSPDLIPEVGSALAAGMDLKTSTDFALMPGQEILIDTGVAVELIPSTVGIVAPRSSISKFKNAYIVLKNGVGVIDADYRGTIKVSLRNMGTEPMIGYRGDRIVQMIIVPHLRPDFNVVDKLSETIRGSGSFGHSGGYIKPI